MNKIQESLNKLIDNKNCFGAVLSINKDSNTQTFSAGNFKNETQYFIASTTKLFTTSIIFQLLDENKLKLDDYIYKYLDENIVNKLHINKNEDYTKKIKIKHLLSQTSGLPDYFEDKRNGSSLLDELLNGQDNNWTFEETIEITKSIKSKFPPSEKKAFYSDTNYQLLGRIIENILKDKIENLFNKRIIDKLNLENTYLYIDDKDNKPMDMYYKKKQIHIPKAMASFKPDGGIVSTSEDMIIFIKAFFERKLFNFDIKKYNHKWNRVMFPLEYGLGLMRFKLPRILTPGFQSLELLGHSGLSGAFAFYNPDKEIYITGTVNQINNPGQSFKLMLKVLGDKG